MKTITLHTDKILSSDWHVLHQNIYWFVPEARSLLSGISIQNGITGEEFLQAERNTYQLILDEITAATERQDIRQFIFLGDLVFGLNKRRGLAEKLETIAAEIPQFHQLFQHLKSKNIESTLLLGNHDDYKLQNAAARRFYESLFDRITHHILDQDTLYTHFPLGYSRAQEATQGTPAEKFYRISKSFKRLDQQLLAEIGDRTIVNYHGHIHKGPFPYALPNVRYHNAAIDILVESPEAN